MAKSPQTPMMKQYLEIKSKHTDSILFFRMGDFYEMFGEDAFEASKILQITLTTRDKGKKDQLPMCGIPYFSAENYIEKLIRSGVKVAICEQVEDPKDAVGILKREVVRVITPGTYLPENQNENNYIICLFQKGNIVGYAVADITTGDFSVFESTKDILDETSRFEPKEILLPASFKNNPSVMDSLDGFYITAFEDWHFDYTEAYRKLLKYFHVASLEGYGCEDLIVSISAAGALISYLQDLQRGNIDFRKIKVLRQQNYMLIDAATRRNLEIDRNLKDGSKEGSLLSIIDTTSTSMGGRLIRSWLHHVLLDLEQIEERQRAIDFFFNHFTLLSQIKDLLKKIRDIERLTMKISLATANGRDLLSLSQSLILLPDIYNKIKHVDNHRIKKLMENLDVLSDVTEMIERTIRDDAPAGLKDGGLINEGVNTHLDELRTIRREGKDFIASIEKKEREKTGITSLKIGYNKVFGYYIEVSKTNLSMVPNEYIRKQTLVGGERFITQELKGYEDKVIGAEEKIKNLEYDIFIDLRKTLLKATERLFKTAASIAEIDVLCSLAMTAKNYNYTVPRLDHSGIIQIEDGRHPVLERMLLHEKFVPNDILLDPKDKNTAIITGPNMAGKSTYMRQIAIIVLLAQIGSFVPAKKATIGIIDRIFTRIGAADYIAKGQSTFMVEMMETAAIVNNATHQSLIILDEIGRGTSTFDGISIAWAVVEFIAKKIKSKTLFATHYHELTELSKVIEGVKNLNVLIREWGDEIIFLRKIVEGPADRSYGIQVAKLAGLPEEIIYRSKEILSNLENAEFNEVGIPKIAKRRGKKQNNLQLNLFASPEELVKEEIINLNLSQLTPEEALKKLQDIRQRLLT